MVIKETNAGALFRGPRHLGRSFGVRKSLDDFEDLAGADGLAAGKGVIIAETDAQAQDAIETMFGGGFGDAGAEHPFPRCARLVCDFDKPLIGAAGNYFTTL